MKLSKKLFDEIIYTVEISPYESGGFLGGVNDAVTNVVYDRKIHTSPHTDLITIC